MKPCLSCGHPTDGSRCTGCSSENKRQYPDPRRRSTRGRGYDHNWKRLSERARRLQPFCIECSSPFNLTSDHLPSAWWRRQNGLLIRLEDIEVVCAGCNSDRGSSRPGSARYEAWIRRQTWGAEVDGGAGDPGPQGTDTIEDWSIS